MRKLEIFCTSLKPYLLLDKLPKYIKPLGLGENDFPPDWLSEKKGDNIKHLNRHYGEISGFYWIWKNIINQFNDEDFVGFCHYRKLWLNYFSESKKKKQIKSLYKDLLQSSNNIFEKVDVIQVQPILFKNRNLLEDFDTIHKTNLLIKSLDFLKEPIKSNFFHHLNGNVLFPLNMFIVKKSFFIEYCNELFPWLEKCMIYCEENKLTSSSYNIRLPAFLAERFTSFWFNQYKNKTQLSYARLGNFLLSEKLNKLINPLKIPFTSRMYPTIHNY